MTSTSHELPNSTSNINDTHEAYFHFENKRNAVQGGTHVNLGKKEMFKIFWIRIRIRIRILAGTHVKLGKKEKFKIFWIRISAGTHVKLGKKENFKIFWIRIDSKAWYRTRIKIRDRLRARVSVSTRLKMRVTIRKPKKLKMTLKLSSNSVQWRQQYYLTHKASLCPSSVAFYSLERLWISWNSRKFQTFPFFLN